MTYNTTKNLLGQGPAQAKGDHRITSFLTAPLFHCGVFHAGMGRDRTIANRYAIAKNFRSIG